VNWAGIVVRLVRHWMVEGLRVIRGVWGGGSEGNEE
jgi:hypothetical protein